MADRKEAAAIAGSSARSSLAVATLLRLADADLRDAAVLESGRDPGNAPALAGRAVARMVEAVMVTEVGWPCSAAGQLDLVPDQNPLKRSLAGAAALLPLMPPPVPLDDGRAPPAPDRGMLRECMLAARAMLKELSARFEVDLFGHGPAGRVAPVRREPSPPARQVPEPPPPKRASRPAPAKPSPAARSEKIPSKAPTTTTAPRRPIEKPPSVEPHDVGERSPIEARPRAGSVASTAFWSLMDLWRVPDAEALDLIGHPGGLTKKGTRPRFKLTGDEVVILQGLQEVDAALVPLKLDPARWLYEPIEEFPFDGATPLALLARTRSTGIRETIRFIVRHGLKMSMST